MRCRSTAHRVECFFHCWPLLLVAAAVALCDVAAAQNSRCGSADPDQVDRIPVAVIQQAGNVFLIIDWLPPDHEQDRHYYYILRCDTCPNQQANVTGVEDHTFEGLQPATEYSFSIQAGYQNCTLSLPFDLVGRTVLSNLPGTVLISDVTQTSLRAQWAASPDVGVQYRVSCGGTVSTNSIVCYGLQSGSRIEVRVQAVKTGFPDSNSIFGTALTKLYPIAASPTTYSVTENAISVNWTASVTEGVRYQLSCSQSGSSDVIQVESSDASATCGPLQSGQAYELSVTVLKDGGFESVSTNLTRQLTKLFAIEASSAEFNVTDNSIFVSWAPSATEGVTYLLSCNDVSVPTDHLFATCDSLESGQVFVISVTVLKNGGYHDAVTRLPNQLTKLLAIDARSANSTATETTITATWKASQTRDVFYELSCSLPGTTDVTKVNSTDLFATCSRLKSGQVYELSVAVRKEGGFDDVSIGLSSQLTKLFAIDASSAVFNITETSIFVLWTGSQTEGVTYQLNCNDVSVPSNDSFATCHSLESGQVYAVSVTVLKGGYDNAITHLPNQLTKLFAIEASSANATANQTAITVTWVASKTAGVTYELTSSRSGSTDVIKVSSSDPSATCASLQSGQVYELSVAVQKEGFLDAFTRLSPALTKLFAIDSSSARFNSSQTSLFVSWNPSITTDVSYLLTCTQQGSGAVTEVRSSDPFATCDSLQSGEKFSVRVAVQKRGDYPDAFTELPEQLTKLFSVNSSSAIYSVNATAISVSWLASVTQRVSYQLRCRRSADEAVLRNVSLTDEPRPSATCDSLAPGQVYSLDLAVWKAGGYETVISQLDTQLTVPLLSSDLATFGAVADSVALNDSHAEVVLRLNWTASAAQGADRFVFTARSSASSDGGDSASDIQLETEVQFEQLQHELSLADLFSRNVTVAVTAVADKSNLVQRSPERTIAAGLATPPKRPLMSLTADKRAIDVTLTASSSSNELRATVQTGSEISASCLPDPSSKNCTVRFETLRPYSNYTVKSVAVYSALPSLPLLLLIQTLEDAPTPPKSVRLSVESLPERLLCDWQPPSELNGVIRNYSAVWGLLDFVSGAELLRDTKVAPGHQTRLQLLQSPLPGHVYFCRVCACTGGGCGDCSDRAVRRLPDGASRAVSDLLTLPVPGRSVGFNWTTMNPVEGRGVVFEYVLRIDGVGGCATARMLNCSDCGRHRQQLPSEALQRLEQLTSDCGQPVPLQAFSIGDSRLALEVPVSSSSLLPWTEYNATLWPVNLAGLGAAITVAFRSPEAPSGPVRSLRATAQQTEALVEFQEPELLNGQLMAIAVQVWVSPSECSQLQVLNSTAASCQLPSCSTEDIVSRLAEECSSVRTGELQIEKASSNESAPLLSVMLQQLQAGTEYTVRVTPVSQTVSGARSELRFTTSRGGGGGGNVTLVVAIVVSVVVVMAMVAGMLLFIWNRRRISSPNQTPTATQSTPSPNAEAIRPPTSSNNIPMSSIPSAPAPLPLAEPPPAVSVRVSDFLAYAARMLADAASLCDQQYAQLKTKAAQLTRSLSTGDGLIEENREKNRYINILPYDSNRVRLSGDSDYINASFVSGLYDSADRPGFIACQGPRPSTVNDHWQMIWEQSVPVIVMLTECVEKGKAKCEQYWPTSEGDSINLDCGLEVTLTGQENCGTYFIRNLRLRANQGSTKSATNQMETTLLQYVAWEDHAVPNLEDLANFLSLVHSMQKCSGGGPIVVHCSAGVGRTGTFIAMDMLARRLQECQDLGESGLNSLVSVYDTVLQLRKCRVDMVQTKHQYAFIYRFLQLFVKNNMRISFIADNDKGDDSNGHDPVYVTAVSSAARVNQGFESEQKA